MKYFLSLLISCLFVTNALSQDLEYIEDWKKVHEFEISGLPKSALEVVEEIALKAKNDNTPTQIVKTLIFKGKFALTLEENAQLKVINDFKAEIAKSSFPERNILEGLLANLYWQYFQNNRYKFYNRTKTENKVDTVDFRTWDLKTLFNQIFIHFNNSLQDEKRLQNQDLKKYKALILSSPNSKTFRPTLYDFLAHDALNFYKTSENSITQPSYKFEIDNPDFLNKAEDFVRLEIKSKDSTSLQLHALKLYQDLVEFHLKDSSPVARVDVDIQRLKYIYQSAVFTNKQEALLQTLQEGKERYKDDEVGGLYDFEIADIYFIQSKKYKPKTNPEYRWSAKEAMEICKNVMTQFPKSTAAKKCENLTTTILSKSLSIKTESYLPVGMYAKVLVSYKNVSDLSFKILEINKNQLTRLNGTYKKDEQLELIGKLKPVIGWSSNLKDNKDYQAHSTEIKIPKLKNGRYLIYADDGNEIFAFSSVQVTNFAVVEKKLPSKVTYQVINRVNGKPIQNASAKISYQKNYRNRVYSLSRITNTFGEFSIEKDDDDNLNNIRIEVNKNEETAVFGAYNIYHHYTNKYNTLDIDYKAFLFTDRGIYRPGQTVYFKAIAMQTFKAKSEVLANKKFTVDLYDVNDDEVASLVLTSNEFGSVSGEFVLPSFGLNGNYYINIYDDDEIDQDFYFSVEEYKRPKFEAKFNPVKESFKVNDSISVTGNAKAFAGSNITDAKVVYRIKRQINYPGWYYWYRPYFYNAPQEISHGETTTDASGNFDIRFKAIPDKSANKSDLPIFKYEITADITDINGETRSASTTVNVGYHTLTARIDILKSIDKTQKENSLTIDTKNLNGEFVPAEGTLKIYKLKPPQFVLRPRPWNAPDYKEYSKENFKKLFPYEAYEEEQKIDNWDKGELVFNTSFNTETSKTIALKSIRKWNSGAYLIELESTDKFGQKVKDIARTTLFSPKDKSLTDNKLFSISTDKTSYKPGEIVRVRIGSSAKDINVFVAVEKQHNFAQTYNIELSNSIKTIEIPVTSKDIGGFTIHYSYAFFNSFKYGTLHIDVPYPVALLDIETLSFRDKIQPGAEETWSFKIKGLNKDQATAEILASMYDMSLDQFKGHSWNFNPISKPKYYSGIRYNARNNFSTKNLKVTNSNQNYYVNVTQNYDNYNWYGLNLGNSRWLRNQYLRQMRANSSISSSYSAGVAEGYVDGVIYDDNGIPLPGATIVIKGSTTGVTTDFDGNFSIKASENDVLTISYLGYQTAEFKIKSNTNYLSISLFADNNQLDEVVVVGYGTAKRKKNINADFEEDLDKGYDYVTGSVASVSIRGVSSLTANEDALIVVDGVVMTQEQYQALNPADIEGVSVVKGAEATSLYGARAANGLLIITTKTAKALNQVHVRTNLQETAFFYPNLKTDKEGNVTFSFTSPEALTQWKLQLLAHTKNLESASTTLQTVTQKELMVLPNVPRFLREGDTITISSKIANITSANLSGQAVLQLFDALSGENISGDLLVISNEPNSIPLPLGAKNFRVEANGNTNISWKLSIPKGLQAVQYKIIAKTQNFSDGEQSILPVLTNRMLVTETMPMWIGSNQTKTFTLDKLKTVTSTTLKNHNLTLEITSNPAWYAVQALPYLMEYPYACNEQTFSRYYANALASHIANSNARIQEVFKQWKNTDALMSNLEKNQELKSLLIQETPWVREAQSEAEQKKRIGLLFDLNKMSIELNGAVKKLEQNQLSNGSWPWFDGGRGNRFVTQHIITGFGHLKQLKVNPGDEESSIVNKAIKYLDDQFIEEYMDLKKYSKDIDLSKDHLSNTQLHYLYMRSFYPEVKASKKVKDIILYYQSQIKKYWQSRALYNKGLMALIMHRASDRETSEEIIKSLKENSITSEELGMYWKENTNSWYWYQAPIETHALLIEAFSEIENDPQTLDNLKIWLLKNKQTNRWKTTKATTEAVYALLLKGSDWLSVTDMVDIEIAGEVIDPSQLEPVKIEAGTGYFKTSWKTSQITPEHATVKLSKKGEGIAWGGLYWQYFEDLDKITFAETPLQLKKKLFLKTNTDYGEELKELSENTALKIGDVVRVRIELRTDRNMEFLHMKDMRAAGFEPVNVISRYKYQDGLGYYESTKDAATNFFIDYLPKGIYVFEYDLRVNNSGNMSNGITSIQSMYAPEFSSHSEGIRVQIEE